MNFACHMIEAAVRHGCTVALLNALKAHSELAFVAGITRIILTKDEGSDLFVLFLEINDLCNVSATPSSCLKL